MGETTASRPGTPPTATRSRGLNITLWVLQVLLALQFLGAGVPKILGAEQMVTMFDNIGAGQWFRYLVGTLEIAGAIGLLIPVLTGLAALCLSIFMVFAALTNIFILGDPVWLPLGVLIVSALVAWGRWPRAKSLIARFVGGGSAA